MSQNPRAVEPQVLEQPAPALPLATEFSAAGEDSDEYDDIDLLILQPIDLTESETLPHHLAQRNTTPISINSSDSSDRGGYSEPSSPIASAINRAGFVERPRLEPGAISSQSEWDGCSQGSASEWGGFTDHDGDTSDDEDIPNPPNGISAPTIEGLQNAVNAWAKTRGFAVTRQHGKKNKRGEYARYYLVCDRFGQPRFGESAGLRETGTRKCGCTWKSVAKLTQDGWVFRNSDEPQHHNHGPSSHASAHPQHRKIAAEVLDTIVNASKHHGIRSREIGALIRDGFPDSSYIRKDIYNARAKIRKEKLGGYTPAGALIKSFDENGIKYRVKWADEDETELLALVFTFNGLMDITKQYSDVMQIDLTYNTNCFGYPLYQVAGLTGANTIYNSIFGFIDNERKEAFDWLCQGTHELRAEFSVEPPIVILTDHCKELKAALLEVFPDSQQQICIYHVIKNVLLNAKKKFKRVESPDFLDEEAFEGDEDVGDDGGSAEVAARLNAEEATALARIRSLDDPGVTTESRGPFPHDHNGVEALFKVMVYSETEDQFYQA